MSEAGKTIFTDRRARAERRQQTVAMPVKIDRRQDPRRERGFKSKPWWLQVGYATELVLAKEVAQAVNEIRQPRDQQVIKPSDKSTEG